MADCEICGRREGDYFVLIEGAKLVACRSCSHGTKILQRLREDESDIEIKQTSHAIESEELVEDYTKIIRKAREQKNISLRDLARKLNEAESFLDHIEKGKLRPTIKVAKKLEKELGIKLIETKKEASGSVTMKKQEFKEPTLADLLEEQKK
ncbi:MAG TPA: multiprotein-bridging factor 1 family protein [Candidatus Bilamarchaeaceae archaeon]|nr:multiprotein-bridging factor 1 family protein [Candidatus Bilamarchaeaceae archaeon]